MTASLMTTIAMQRWRPTSTFAFLHSFLRTTLRLSWPYVANFDRRPSPYLILFSEFLGHRASFRPLLLEPPIPTFFLPSPVKKIRSCPGDRENRENAALGRPERGRQFSFFLRLVSPWSGHQRRRDELLLLRELSSPRCSEAGRRGQCRLLVVASAR